MFSRFRENIFTITASVLVTLAVIVFTGGIIGCWLIRHPNVVEKFATYYSVSGQPVVGTTKSDETVVGIVKRANPAVVAVMVSKEVPRYEQYLRSMPGPFGNFFDFQVPEVRQNGVERKEIGGGSGFLVSEDGYIVTNKHVVSDEEADYAVFTSDGTKYPAHVVARDSILDIAVIKIEGKKFPFLSFGNSDELQAGQSVIAIGNALAEYRNTVSVGVVSGLSRSITAGDGSGGAETLNQLIQTDAAINLGNSGGPLLDLKGEVIGVNVAVANGAENIGFSLNANSVKNVVASVQKTGKIVRPFIGVRYIPITKELKDKNHLSVDYGILVQRGAQESDLAVVPGSPGDKAGIVENDIILEIDGEKITETVDFSARIRAKQVGDTVQLKVLHKGDEKEITVKLEEMK